jgi:hypothetical protein
MDLEREYVLYVWLSCAVMEGPQMDIEREVTSKFSLLEGQLQTKLFTQVNEVFYLYCANHGAIAYRVFNALI